MAVVKETSVAAASTLAQSNFDEEYDNNNGLFTGSVPDAIVLDEDGVDYENVDSFHPIVTAIPLEKDESSVSTEVGDEREPGESAAARKRRKKKEKEKEKKAVIAASASASEVKEENAKNTASSGKKTPKHVREMVEKLARLKEAEEKRIKEEEERLMKEAQEELERQEIARKKEEDKRRKKDIQKAKLLKKRAGGVPITAKQKEEARRLEAMRNQILANGGVLPTNETNNAASKQSKHKTKQTNPAHVQPMKAEKRCHEVTTELDSVEVDDKVKEIEVAMGIEQGSEGVLGDEDKGVKDQDWDAKSWEDTTINLGIENAFSEVKAGIPITQLELGCRSTLSCDYAGCSNTESSTSGKNQREEATKEGDTLSAEALRSPICCIMGHVDTGKTKLLDCIRKSNVQEGEAGGITQQIGATYFPADNIRGKTKELKADVSLRVPGLLVIDTPGHESFANLRSRGSSLCDIAVLVVDIMHGLENQTKESVELLQKRNTEFIVALNKVDRLYGWKTCPNAPIRKALDRQTKAVQDEFKRKVEEICWQFKALGLNTKLYYQNKEMRETYCRNKQMRETTNIVPTSAVSGEGIPDLLLLMIQWTPKTIAEKLMFSNEVQCTVLEVKVIEGLGTTIDVILVNGVLKEGDQIVVCGMQGAIVTSIRSLLTPEPMKELRLKGSYVHHKEIKAAQSIKITAHGLEHATPGTPLYVVGPEDNLEDAKRLAMQDMNSVMGPSDKSKEGVCVQASTLGSLEALLEFLKSPAVDIPVSGISIGPVHKRDVMKASVMLERKKEYATILAFDVKVTPEAKEVAEESGVKIFTADIIYHLFDQFKAYIDNIKEQKKKEVADEAIFPCVLKIVRVFNQNPIILGVDVLDGIAKVGTPVSTFRAQKNKSGPPVCVEVGQIASMEINRNPVVFAKKGQKVAIKIASLNPKEREVGDELVSHISRSSIDVLKAYYREESSMEDWELVKKLKRLFKIK
ncbi:hypothetical protein ACHQM5_021252 [Ranunculus cassubicifolius]